MSRLEWRTVTGSQSPKFFVKHTRLAVAFYKGYRFGIYEMRGSANADGSYDDYYAVTDAHTVSDAEVAAGVSPKIVFRHKGLDLEAVLAWCEVQP